MRKLEIDLMPATKAQINVDFSVALGDTEESTLQILLAGWGERMDSRIAEYLTGDGVADAINLKNIQFQNIENVRSISLVAETEIAGNIERKEYDLSPYNTMDAFQREKITLDGSITVRKGTRLYVKFDGIDHGDDTEPLTPSCVAFADLTRHYCC